jgi:L,D-transpeptidase YcbB
VIKYINPVINCFKLSCLLLIILLLFGSCGQQKKKREIILINAAAPAEQVHVLMINEFEDVLSAFYNDSTSEPFRNYIKEIYKSKRDSAIWTKNTSFLDRADSLIKLLEQVHEFGLFPENYGLDRLKAIRAQVADSSKTGTINITEIAETDLRFTSAFVHFIKDVKVGRLIADSSIVRDSAFSPVFFVAQLDSFQKLNIIDFTVQLEPKNPSYIHLKEALKKFLKQADLKPHSRINGRDSLMYRDLVYRRLCEEDTLKLKTSVNPDSITLARAIKKYQKFKKLPLTGTIGQNLINGLNNNDYEKFIKIAINLDRYKEQQQFPVEYVLVNLPSFMLQLVRMDTIQLSSRIICGKPNNNTPEISSTITNMVTYPKWTIPPGIIKKEVLPALKADPGYIYRKGFTLIDNKGNIVNPYSVRWSKYKDDIPYDVVQGSGDENALGILKFNFPNKYYIYLHDTNQRYLFTNSKRALSHGCVRVQEWKKLADYLLVRDSASSVNATPVDSLDSWLLQKKRMQIHIHNPMPIYIRYYTCAGEAGKLKFYDDIYGEDLELRNTMTSQSNTGNNVVHN